MTCFIAGRLALAAAVLAVAMTVTSTRVSGQAEAVPAFTAAAVRPGIPGQRGVVSRPRGTEFRSANVTLRQLVAYAYGVEVLRKAPPVEGGPSWADRETFTIIGKSDVPMSFADSRLMVRAMLHERFAVRVRTDVRELPVYALTLADASGRLGSGLRRSASDCAAASRARRLGTPPVATGDARCGLRGGGAGRGELVIMGSGTLDDLIELMARGPEIDRPLVDQTALRGTFDIELRWTSTRAPAAASDGPSLFTAVREQMGLALDARRAPVAVVVIESAERPQLD